MPPKEMPKEVSIMGGCPVPNLCSHLLVLAEVEAEGKAKAPRLRAQQGGCSSVAKGKKGRLRAAWGLLRHVWSKREDSRPQAGERPEGHDHVFVGEHTASGSYYSCSVCGATPSWEPERRRKFAGAVPKMPSEEEKG